MKNHLPIIWRTSPRGRFRPSKSSIRPLVFLSTAALFLIFAPSAQATSPDGSGVTIAVIDNTGIDSASPELAGVVVHEVCLDALASLGIANYGAHCPNNKSIDETSGAAATSFNSNGESQYPGGGHGTAVASVIAGTTVGIAKGVKIVAIRELHLMSPAFDWLHANARKYNISAVVMSEAWSISADSRGYVPCSQAAESKPNGQQNALAPYIATLRADGLAVFIAAGNEGFTSLIDSPSCIQGVFGVGASSGEAIAGYSNISSEVSILAPGTNMVSTLVSQNNFTLTSQLGTSFATPYAGAVYAKVKALYPLLTADQILAAMRSTGTLTDDTKVKHIPIINEDKLFAFLATGNAIPLLSSTLADQEASYSPGNSDFLLAQIVSLQAQVKDLQGRNDSLIASEAQLVKAAGDYKSDQDTISALGYELSNLQAKDKLLKSQLTTALKSIAASGMKTVTCTKGGSIKSVSAIKPVCPLGWRIKG